MLVDIGFSFVRRARPLEMFPTHAPALAARAEEMGFESCWLSEHLVKPTVLPQTHPHSPGGRSTAEPDTDLYDPFVALAAVGALTNRIKLGTNVYVLPLRNPFVTARAVGTLDIMTSGRVILGAGVGWLKPEFDIVGEDFHNRGARTDEIIEIIRRLWTDEEPEFHGRFYDFPPCRFEPKPLQKPTPPILGSGAVAASLRRAARLCDGWIADPATARDLNAVERNIVEIARLRAEFDRAATPFDIQVMADLDADRDTRGRLEDIGVTRVVISPLRQVAVGRDALSQDVDELERAAQHWL
jgi:probable F420-dependent oxidoreductase